MKVENLTHSVTLSYDKSKVQRPKQMKKSWQVRNEILKRKLADLDQVVQDVLETCHKTSIQEISDFVQHAQVDNGQIPTGLILGGMNASSDHEVLFTKLFQIFTQNGHVCASLISKDCSNLKSTMRNFIEQFMGLKKELEDENNKEMSLHQMFEYNYPQAIYTNVIYKNNTASTHDIQTLAEWYANVSSERGVFQLVLFIQDFEGFDSNLMVDLISILCENMGDLPIVLLVNVATTGLGFQTCLPISLLSQLQTTSFQLSASSDLLNALVKKILIEPVCGMKLDSKTFSELLKQYQLYDLSIHSFYNNIKFCYMLYYYNNHTSILEDFDEFDVANILEKRDLETLRMQKSFIAHMDKLAREGEKDEVKRLLSDDEYFVKRIPHYLKVSEIYHKNYSKAFQCLLYLQNMVNNPTLRRPVRRLYEISLNDELDDLLRTLFQILIKKPLEDVEKYLKSCIELLRDDSEFEKTVKSLEDFIGKIQTFKQDVEPDINDDELPTPPDQLLDQVSSMKQRKTNVAKRTSLFSALVTVYETPQQNIVKKIVLGLQDFFDQYLAHYSGVLWNEIIYFSNNGRIQKAFNPSTRLAIHSAISNPGYFLGTDEAFDITILHKLYLECGRLINMYDWFIAFKTMVDPDARMSDKEAQIRFMKGTSELQLMGYIKPTDRKTDHVERLTWGI